MHSIFQRVFVAVIFVLAFVGLATVAMAGNKPVPLINQPLVPDAVAPGGPAFILTVNGTGFVAKSKANWNGSPRATTFVSKSQLTAKITAADIAKAGTGSVTVVNPTPGGGTSNVAFESVAGSTTNIGFSAPSSFAAGDSPDSTATGDFNGDGNLDLAVVDFVGYTVTIFLGDGEGNFTMASTFPTGKEPNDVAVGDFNGDGKLDLAVTISSGDNNRVSIFLGDGTGNFTLTSSAQTGSGPGKIVTGDFNSDGNLDLAMTAPAKGSVIILLGDGTGNFTLTSSPQTGEEPVSLALGDFNGDGRLDLAVTNSLAGTLTILLGDGTGHFSTGGTLNSGFSPSSVAAGDFNGDGKLDLAVANSSSTSNTISIFLGDGKGNFTLAHSLPLAGEPQDVTIGDFNGDGRPDLAVGGILGGLSILLGDGTGNFTLASSQPGDDVRGLAVGDFNSDGRPDIAALGISGDVSIFLQAPAVALSPGSFNFGTLVIGTTSAPQTATATNVGYAAVDISGVTITGQSSEYFSETNDCPASLAVGASCTITATFAPVEGGMFSGTISLSGNGGYNPPGISLTGNGVSVVLSPASLNFGDVKVGQTSAPMVSTLTNMNSHPITIKGAVAGGKDPGDFSETNTCPRRLPSGSSCTFTVLFIPTQTGSRTAKYKINDTDAGGIQVLPVMGNGT